MGHLGTENVVELAKWRIYLPGIYKDIDTYIRRKLPRVKQKQPNWEDPVPLVPIKTTYPFEIRLFEFFKMDKAKGDFEYVFVVNDHCIRYARHLQPKPNLQKHLQRSCTMFLLN